MRSLFLIVLLLVSAGCRDRQPGPQEPARAYPEMPFPETPGLSAQCAAGDSLVVLADGPRCATGSDFHAAPGQPAFLLSVTEADGRRGAVLFDLGSDPERLASNLAAWKEVAGGPARSAIVLSHGHAYSGLFMPARGGDGGGRPGLREALAALGDVPVSGANLPDLCRMGGGLSEETAELCAGTRGKALRPGLEPLQWSDGSSSTRVWTYTWAFSEGEHARIAFQPLETLLVIARPPGYAVVAACSHPPAEVPPDRAWHAAARVQEEIDAGRLPPGPIHTVISGLCGVVQARDRVPGAERRVDDRALAEWWRSLRERLGLERLFLVHCALLMEELFPVLADVPGLAVEAAWPGACIPLSR